MSKAITLADLEAETVIVPDPAFPWIGRFEPFFPLYALCKRHGWQQPSSDTLRFIESCEKRLQRRLEQAIQSKREV